MTHATKFVYRATVVAVFLACLPTCKQVVPTNNDNKTTVRKGVPVTPIKKPTHTTKAARTITSHPPETPTKSELFATQIVDLKGTSAQFCRSRFEKEQQAEEGAQLFGGGFLKTGENAQATLPIRRVGTAHLLPHAELYIPEYLPCGTLLVSGKITLTGPPEGSKTKGCMVHTPAVSIWTPTGSEGSISVSARGDTWLVAKTGALHFVNLENETSKLDRGNEIILDSAGDSKTQRSTDGHQKNHNKKHLKWLVARALRKKDEPTFIRETMAKAEEMALRLEQNVGRLIELKGLNRHVSEELRAIDSKTENRAKQLKRTLTGQAQEMIDLKNQSSLVTHRILALRQLALSKLDDTKNLGPRIEALNNKIAQLAEKLPEFFDRPTTTLPRKESGD